jgi:hypothetical protein
MRLGSAQVGEAERKAVEEVLNDQVFYRYHGSKVTAVEQRFAAGLLDGRRTLAVNSGSSALQIAFAALDTEPGFEVLVPVLGFVSAATAVIAAGGMPRFVPVDRSLGIDVPGSCASPGLIRHQPKSSRRPGGCSHRESACRWTCATTTQTSPRPWRP